MLAKFKNAWKSFTIWINGMFGALWWALENFGDGIKDNLPMVQQYLTPQTLKYAVVTLIVLNLGLRFKTNKSLADK